VQARRGARQAALLGDRDEVAELAQLGGGHSHRLRLWRGRQSVLQMAPGAS
jgi:hypothetical protein